MPTQGIDREVTGMLNFLQNGGDPCFKVGDNSINNNPITEFLNSHRGAATVGLFAVIGGYLATEFIRNPQAIMPIDRRTPTEVLSPRVGFTIGNAAPLYTDPDGHSIATEVPAGARVVIVGEVAGAEGVPSFLKITWPTKDGPAGMYIPSGNVQIDK